MFCQRVLGNLEMDGGAFSRPQRDHDVLDLRWWELDRRAIRRKTRGGREIRLLLMLGESLGDGDVLFDDGTTLVVLRVVPAEVLVVRPGTLLEMGVVSLVIGNLHAPAEIIGEEILIAPDGPVEAELQNLGLKFDRQVRRFQPRRCTGMPVLQISPEFEVRS